MSVLDVDGIYYSYAKTEHILSDIALTCRKGEVVGLIGNNGAGKSTLLNIIWGKINAIGASIRLDGTYIPPAKRALHISYLPQGSCLPKDVTVQKCLRLYLSKQDTGNLLYRHSRLKSVANQRIGHLSGGELRLLEILLILSLDHPFVLLDEPFCRIEPLYIEAIKQLLLEKKDSKGFVVTDQYYHDILDVCSPVYLLRNGALVRVKNQRDLEALGYLPAPDRSEKADFGWRS